MTTDIFETIDTKEKAYWLGFAHADGYINKTSTMFRFCLSVKDEDHLDRFIRFVNGDLAFKRYYGPYKTSGKQVHFCINNKVFVGNLIKHGCFNRKSKLLRFPFNLQENLRLSFLMGVYDGDGTGDIIKKKGTTTLCSGSRQFLDDIKSVFKIPNNISSPKSQYEVYYLSLGRTLYEQMISDFNSGLESKRNNFLGIPQKSDIELIKKKRELNRRLFNRPVVRRFDVSKERLQYLLDMYPMEVIGKMFGVRGNSIKKRAKSLSIYIPRGRGYWAKQKMIKSSSSNHHFRDSAQSLPEALALVARRKYRKAPFAYKSIKAKRLNAPNFWTNGVTGNTAF